MQLYTIVPKSDDENDDFQHTATISNSFIVEKFNLATEKVAS